MSEIPPAAKRMKNDLRARINKLPHINPRFQQALVEYFTWLYLREDKPDIQFIADWGEFGDLLTAKSNDGGFRSRLMNLSMNRDDLRAENQRYHHQLAIARGFNFNKGPDGLPVVDVQEAVKLLRDDLLEFVAEEDRVSWQPEVWAGWNWVSLGCGHSSAEGAAAGHCGNSGRRSGDNILSLRDQQNRVHLTFVVNDGTLGEMKAPGNTKPTKLYHPAILALFFSGLVNKIDEGHVYELECNFRIEDLNIYKPDLLKLVHAFWMPLQPKKPANLYAPSYLEQYTQDKVDALSSEEKKQLARIFTNLAADLGWEDDFGEFRQKVQFDVPLLVWQAASVLKPREQLELLERCGQIFNKEKNYFYMIEKKNLQAVDSRILPLDLMVALAAQCKNNAKTLAEKIRLLEKLYETAIAGTKDKATEFCKVEYGLRDDIKAEFGVTPACSPLLIRYVNYLYDHDYADYKTNPVTRAAKDYLISLARIIMSDFLQNPHTAEEWEKMDNLARAYMWDEANALDINFNYNTDSEGNTGDPEDYMLWWNLMGFYRTEVVERCSATAEKLLGHSTHLINKKMLRLRRQTFIESTCRLLREPAYNKFCKAIQAMDLEIFKSGRADGRSFEVKQGMTKIDLLKWMLHDPQGLKEYFSTTLERLQRLVARLIDEEHAKLPKYFKANVSQVRAWVAARELKDWPLEW